MLDPTAQIDQNRSVIFVYVCHYVWPLSLALINTGNKNDISLCSLCTYCSSNPWKEVLRAVRLKNLSYCKALRALPTLVGLT